MQTDSASGIRSHADRYNFPSFAHAFQAFHPTCEAGRLSCLCLRNGAVSFEDFESLISILPPDNELASAGHGSKTFTTGAYVYSNTAGLRSNVFKYPATTKLLASVCFHPNTSPLLVCFASCKRLRMWTRTTSRVVLTCFCQLHIFYMALCGSRDLAVTPSLLRAAHVLGVCLTCLRVLVSWMLNACVPHASGRGRASSLWASVLKILHPWFPVWPHGWMTWGSSCRPDEIASSLVCSILMLRQCQVILPLTTACHPHP